MKNVIEEDLIKSLNAVFNKSNPVKINSKLLIAALVLVFNCLITAADINGRFVVTNHSSSKLAVLIQINTIAENKALGGATIVFGFDTSSINIVNTPINNVDYIYHNFSGNFYSPATITVPMEGRIWVNIDLPFNNSNNGTPISDTTGWTDVVTIYFDIVNVNGSADLFWLSSSPFWGIYNEDNLTILEPNIFENTNYIYDITAPELINAHLLNFETLEAEFSEPLDSTSALNISNYIINNGINILSITRAANPNKLIINTSPHSSGEQYILTVNNVMDPAGNLISTTNNFVEYAFPPSGIDDEKIPTEFILDQNYPNPFNPSTKISWQSPVSSHQTVKVYDVLGNELATLVNEFLPSGYYEVNFEADNLASGVYIYRLNAGEFTETKKMVLLR